MVQTNLIREASIFAKWAHGDRVRPNKAREPYYSHLEDVATLVMMFAGSDEEVAAAWLHDTVEDTGTSIDEIRAYFGEEVAEIVDGLTDKPDLNGLRTLERKRVQAERVRGKSDSVKLVKLADQTSNVKSVAADPPVKWTRQKCFDYVDGAGLVAHECSDASLGLYDQFREAFHEAMQKYE